MIAWWLAAALAVQGPDREACQAAVGARDPAALRDCVERWVIADASDPLADYYGFHLAWLEGDAIAARAARDRALARGLDEPERGEILRMGLPPNPLLGVQRAFLALVLLVGLAGMVWARLRALRDADRAESAAEG